MVRNKCFSPQYQSYYCALNINLICSKKICQIWATVTWSTVVLQDCCWFAKLKYSYNSQEPATTESLFSEYPSSRLVNILKTESIARAFHKTLENSLRWLFLKNSSEQLLLQKIQKNVRESYSEPFKISKMKRFAKLTRFSR